MISSSSRRWALGALATVMGGWAMHPVAASAETGSATIVHGDPGRACAGDGAELAWSPPDGAADVTGYRISHWVTTPSTPQVFTTDVGPDQTSIAFTVPFGLSSFQIHAKTAAGVDEAPYTSASIMGNRAPAAMAWDPAGAAVGDGTATVPFTWHGPVTWATTGGQLPTQIRVTAASTGATITSAAPHDALGVATSFSGLPNGSASTFSAVISNACGSSRASASYAYTSGVGPAWTQASPPLTVARKMPYSYEFVASGTPAVAYRLVGGPAWLRIGPDGHVAGSPPRASSSFSYSVVASNGVGIQPGIMATDIVAGPFTVKMAGR